jgi:2-oxo-4-hydroxy-4-carboxy-5-ureidoimidazoline decarboxylase
LDLIRAHPELAARVELTDFSSSEQMGAGLKQLTAAEFERFSALNAAYREKFGFPFIICVRLQTKASILAAFEARLERDAAAEQAEAIVQIGLIAKLRLQDLMEGMKA